MAYYKSRVILNQLGRLSDILSAMMVAAPGCLRAAQRDPVPVQTCNITFTTPELVP